MASSLENVLVMVDSSWSRVNARRDDGKRGGWSALVCAGLDGLLGGWRSSGGNLL